MASDPRQMLLIPFRKTLSADSFEYLLCLGNKNELWGWVQEFEWSEKEDEELATDLAVKHLGLAKHTLVVDLDARSALPRSRFMSKTENWPEEIFVVPVVCFAVFTAKQTVVLSQAYSQMEWVNYDKAKETLEESFAKTALWELHARLSGE